MRRSSGLRPSANAGTAERHATGHAHPRSAPSADGAAPFRSAGRLETPIPPNRANRTNDHKNGTPIRASHCPGDDELRVYKRIARASPSFPPLLSPEARDLVGGLLQRDPNARLGMVGAPAPGRGGWGAGGLGACRTAMPAKEWLVAGRQPKPNSPKAETVLNPPPHPSAAHARHS